MINISSRSRFVAAASPLAMATMLAASPAFAQETQTAASVAVTGAASQDAAAQPASPAPSADDQAGIVVTGFRASLQNAVNKKKRADQIVESVSAEDIGKLPDASIAESIARLPGVAAQRIAGSGRTSYLSIRGFAPDYSTTLLNGREQTSTGDNRAVEYDQYPSEVVSQVNIYKTPLASVIGQGLAGTVDIRTIRPLEYGKRVISVGGRGVYIDNGKKNDGSKEYGYRLNATYIDQFADGRVGVALAASWNDEPYSLTEFNSWGYPTDPGAAVIGGEKSYVTSTQLKRLGLTGTVQFKPTDYFTSTIDGFYSDFKDDQIKRGIETPLFWSSAALQPGFTVTDGVITSGTFTNVHAVPRNVSWQRNAKLYAFGWNNRYDQDTWHALVDLSYSKVKRNERIFEVWSTTNGVPDIMDFETTTNGTTFTHDLDYSDPNLVVLSDPGGWGGTGYSNNRIVNDRIWQYRGEIAKDLDTGFLSRAAIGANWTNHDKSLTPDEAFIRLPGGAATAVVPTEFLKNPTNLSFLGLGPTLAFDPLDLLHAGIITLVPNNSNPDVQLKSYQIHENLGTLYAQFDINADIGPAKLTGNVGVQAVHTDQSTDGFIAQNGSILPETGGAKYWDVMPSMNLSLRFPNDWVIRIGAAREVMRPRIDDMRSSLRVTVDNHGAPLNPALHTVNADAGNPELRPFRANAADLSFEKYFGIKGYVAAQLFYKYFDTFVVDKSLPGVPFDATGQPLPSPYQSTNPADPTTYVPPANLANATLYQPYNVKGGKLYGIELAGTLPIGEMFHVLDGFGVTGGVSYTKSKIHPYAGGPATDLPGYSKWVANGTAYFEKWGFSLRGSIRYRSSFIGEVYGFGANRDLRRARPETVIDGQVGYEFQPGSALNGLSLYLQGQNLTDEPFVTEGASALQVIDYQKFGRRFMLGANFKFGAGSPPPPPPPPAPPPPPPPPVAAPATQTCPDGAVILATDACPVPPPPPPPPAPAPERGQ